MEFWNESQKDVLQTKQKSDSIACFYVSQKNVYVPFVLFLKTSIIEAFFLSDVNEEDLVFFLCVLFHSLASSSKKSC